MRSSALLRLLAQAQTGLGIPVETEVKLPGKPGDKILISSQQICPDRDHDCFHRIIRFKLTEDIEPIHCDYKINPEDERGPNGEGMLDIGSADCRPASVDETVASWAHEDSHIVLETVGGTGEQSWFLLDDGQWLDITEKMSGKVLVDVPQSVLRPRPNIVRAVPRLDGGSLEYADEWALGDVYRYIVASAGKPGMALIFTIEHPDYDSVVCVVTYTGREGQDPTTMSFFDKPCQGINWGVSWGYNEKADEDVATMTLANEKRDRRTFFGFRYINDNPRLGDKGPEKTEKY